MSLYADRVKDSTSVTGTGAVTLSGTAPTGFQSFATAFGATPQTVAYCIADQTGNNWEVGTGVFNGTTGLTRVTVLASSNGGSLVNFTGGTQDVFCTAPAKYLDTFTSTNQGAVPASGGGTTNFLRADGTFAAPPAVTPASPATSVQFNNAGAFGGNANFTYNTGTNTVSFGNITGSALGMTIQPLAPTSGSAGVLTIKSRNAAGSTGNGGDIIMTSGQSGTLVGYGGNFTMTSGYGISGNGGDFTMASGQGGTTGGAFYIAGGGGQSAGGNVDISSGGGDSGPSGDIAIYTSAGATANGSLALQHYGMKIDWFDDGSGNITNDIGFFGATPVAKPTPTASGTGAVLSSVVTALNSLGLVDSTALTNATTITPAGSTTQIQFNNAGAFGATAGFSYNTSTSTFNIAPASTSVIIEPVAPTGAQTSTGITLRTKNASATNGAGGSILVSTGAGLGTGFSGGISFTTGASSNICGNMSFVTGSGTNQGGGMSFAAGSGTGTNGYGGGITLQSGIGNGTGGGGYFSMAGGDCVGTGGGGGYAMLGGASFFGTGGDFQILSGYGGAASGTIYIGTDSNASCFTITEDGAAVSQMGFFNATPVAKPVVTGSRATGAALVSLLTQLASLGLITDSTTA